MTVWTAVVGFFTSLPQIIDGIKKIAVWINQVSGGDVQGWILRQNKAFDDLNKATTVEEYANAAKEIQNLIRRRPT